MELHLKITGILLIVLGLFHVIFPNYFKWKEELALVSRINREIMYVHTFFIGLTVLLMGILCFGSSRELITTGLGRKICLGMAIFWVSRLLIQLFGFSSLLWKGKRFETSVHLFFTALWIYFTGVFIWISWYF